MDDFSLMMSEWKTGVQAAINNLEISGSFNNEPWYATWNENNIITRGASIAPSLNMEISALISGSCTVTNDNNAAGGTYVLTIVGSNILGQSSSASINISVPCFIAGVLLVTREGPIVVEDLVIGSEMLQPNGTYSKVVAVKRSLLTESVPEEDRRLFADPEEKCIVTFWHKVSMGGDDEVKAGEYTKFHEVFRNLPIEVFHIKLEKPVIDKLMVYDSDIVCEGFIPVNPA